MYRSRLHNRTQGISLIEVLVAVTILSIALIFIGYAITLFVTARHEMLADTQAVYLAEEGYELIRAIRNDDWNTIDGLTPDTPFTLEVSTTTIAIGSGPEVFSLENAEFRRTFEVRFLYRDSDGDVVASTTPGSSMDTEGRELLVRVGSEYGTTTLRAIVTNIFVQ